MLGWLRKVLDHPALEVRQLDGELHAARERHVRIVKRADRVVAEAFRHADQAVAPKRRDRVRP